MNLNDYFILSYIIKQQFYIEFYVKKDKIKNNKIICSIL